MPVRKLKPADDYVAPTHLSRKAKIAAHRGAGLIKFGKLDEALVAWDSFVHLYPEEYEGYFFRGYTLNALGRYDEAITAFDRAIALKPESAAPHTCRGLALERLNRFEEALTEYDCSIDLKAKEKPEHNPQPHKLQITAEAEVHRFRGSVLISLRRLPEAFEAYGRAGQINPADAEARYKQAMILGGLGRFEEAIECYNAAIRIDPENAVSHMGRGATLNILERFDEALLALSVAIDLDPSASHAYFYRGAALMGLERFRDAVNAFDRAIELNPNDKNAREKRGLALAALERSQVKDTNSDVITAEQGYNPEIETKPDEPIKTGTTGVIEIMPNSLQPYFAEKNVPKTMQPKLAAKIERLVAAELGAAKPREKWDERGKYDDLKDLSAVEFLKRVYADMIGPDGAIEKAEVRKHDPALMKRVETYISIREARKQPPGDAEGLRLITTHAGPPKRAALG